MKIIDNRNKEENIDIGYGDIVGNEKCLGFVAKGVDDSFKVYRLGHGILIGRYVSGRDAYTNGWRKVRATLTVE